jgi:hypothetical protein
MTYSRIRPRPPHPPRPSRAAPCRRACRRARPSGRASMRCMRISSAHVHAADTSSPPLTARSSLGDDHRTLCRYITEASMPGREQHVGASSGPKVARSIQPHTHGRRAPRHARRNLLRVAPPHRPNASPWSSDTNTGTPRGPKVKLHAKRGRSIVLDVEGGGDKRVTFSACPTQCSS